MELSQLRYALQLAKTSNFSKAAEQLYITQPALSQQIGLLEEELGLKLFERTTRKVVLTAAGEEFIRGAQKVLDQVTELQHSMEVRRREVGGTLSVGLLSTLSHLNITEYINSFHQIYPNIHIDIQVAWSSELINRVLNRDLDAAITNIYHTSGNQMDSRLNIHIFLKDSVMVLASQKRNFSKQASVDVHSLSLVPIIALEKATSIRAEMDDIFKQCGVHPNIVCTCPNMDSLIAMIRADMGVTFLSSGVASAYMAPDLCCCPLSPAYQTQTAMITRKTTNPSESLRYFEDYFYGITH